MLQAVAFVATIVGILVGIVELRRYLSESREDREFVQSVFKLALVVGLLSYGAYFFYFGPKSAGDDFVAALRRLDVRTIQDKSCEDSELRTAFGGLGGGILSLGSFLASIKTDGEIFVPLANEYRFDWTMISFTEEEWHSAKLHVKPSGPFGFCVDDASGL